MKTEYRTVTDFDVEMTRLFEQARRWYPEQSTEYGHILLLQRYYQGLTGAAQASLNPHGPGKAQDLSSEPGHLERKYTSAARAKGLEYKIGDWVHLSNPDDAARPIVGQIWKTYIPTTKGKRTHHISVAWYYRPEQVSYAWTLLIRPFTPPSSNSTSVKCFDPARSAIIPSKIYSKKSQSSRGASMSGADQRLQTIILDGHLVSLHTISLT